MATSPAAQSDTSSRPGCKGLEDDASGDEEDSQSTVDTLGGGRSSEAAGDEDSQAAAVAAYLEPYYGCLVEDSGSWCEGGSLPVARLRVRIHTEMGGHTVYLVECALTHLGGEESAISWSTTQRLRYLRRHFHDHIKRELGEEYHKIFSATPFAHRMGPPGTTGRLHAWFQTLAACMTAGLLRPSLVADVLRSLQAPAVNKRAAATAAAVMTPSNSARTPESKAASAPDCDPDGI
mmetsp:Transcript_69055/g.174043  ORF Transcript_69055/g.174043 Transcript_69055/m.174043 type:complete len:235 (+) Transcript_69055:75-779(+)